MRDKNWWKFTFHLQSATADQTFSQFPVGALHNFQANGEVFQVRLKRVLGLILGKDCSLNVDAVMMVTKSFSTIDHSKQNKKLFEISAYVFSGLVVNVVSFRKKLSSPESSERSWSWLPSSGVDAGIHLLVLHLLGREHGLVVHNAPDYEHDDGDSGGGDGDTYMSAWWWWCFLIASKGSFYFWIYWHIYASTFNPIGSLSSTEDNVRDSWPEAKDFAFLAGYQES